MFDYDTYWSHKGKYQDLYDKLYAKIPFSGPVVNKNKNKSLERLRKASNAYYDLFNNGGKNSPQSIRAIFGFSPNIYKNYRGELCRSEVHRIVEPIFDKIILDAAEEQGIV